MEPERGGCWKTMFLLKGPGPELQVPCVLIGGRVKVGLSPRATLANQRARGKLRVTWQVQAAVAGSNASILAYGQTSSGKTHSARRPKV